MALFKSRVILGFGLGLIAAAMLAGCATFPDAEKWSLPKKENAESGMIIGRIDRPNNKEENPTGEKLDLYSVDYWNRDKHSYVASGLTKGPGENNFIMDNRYFIIPNLKPGKYYLHGFMISSKPYHVANYAESLTDKDIIEVRAGEIKFAGSFDYFENDRSFIEKVKNTGTFGLRKAKHPTELEMFQWLSRVDAGSGWESAIRKRLRELSKQ